MPGKNTKQWIDSKITQYKTNQYQQNKQNQQGIKEQANFARLLNELKDSKQNVFDFLYSKFTILEGMSESELLQYSLANNISINKEEATKQFNSYTTNSNHTSNFNLSNKGKIIICAAILLTLANGVSADIGIQNNSTIIDKNGNFKETLNLDLSTNISYKEEKITHPDPRLEVHHIVELGDGQYQYNGQMLNDKFDGKGTMSFPDGSSYKGGFKDDKQHGYGEFIDKDGNKSIGNWKNGQLDLDGEIKTINKDGTILTGKWKNGKLEGNAKVIFPDGGQYEGQLIDKGFKLHGKGILTKKDGTRYEGEFENGQLIEAKVYDEWSMLRYDGELQGVIKHGIGKEYKDDKLIYEGEYKNDKFNGKGILHYQYGSTPNTKYEGEFKDNKPNGKGKFIYPNGTIYEGEVVDGKRHGKGKTLEEHQITVRNKYNELKTDKIRIIYEGDFMSDTITGKGKMSFSNGVTYIGEVVDGKRHGKGEFIQADGTRYEGEFQNDKAHGEGTLYGVNNKILYQGKWENDEMITKPTQQELNKINNIHTAIKEGERMVF